MGQDYPFNHALATNRWHQFFVADDPENLGNWHDALQEICKGPFCIEEEYGRIAVQSDGDAVRLAATPHLHVNGADRRITFVPTERTFSDLSYQIRKSYSQFDIQANYRVQEGDDDIAYLTGRIFLRPFSDEEADLKMVAEEIVEEYGDLGVAVRYLDDQNRLLDLYVDGH
ncbi:hypothetical protein [Terasakiella sp. SH-1]|uniref:hypothetical protein n=1 Tax=Terasakiella sp. SH-1 TaxID=2560057 RepID=UPI001072FCA7|nr:hypothetical protein [Terasakiella sp. SH-1]